LLAGLLVALLWATRETTPGLALRHGFQSQAKRVSAVTAIEVEGVDPIAMFLNPEDAVITPRLWSRGVWEPTETSWLVRSLRPGDVFVDVGANVGYYTLLGARLVGERGRVYAFEPDPTNFEILRRNVRLNGFDNVTLEEKAVSDEGGWIQLFLAPSNKGDHRIYQPEGEQREKLDVEAVALDAYFQGREEKVDCLKLDTQGAEAVIVRGMQGLLRRSKSVVMLLEYSPWHLAGLGSTAEDLLGGLAPHGFEMFDFGMGGTELRPLRRVTPERLLRSFSPHRKIFTNLLLVRGRPDLLKRIRAEAGA